jgi:hypothetical protein
MVQTSEPFENPTGKRMLKVYSKTGHKIVSKKWPFEYQTAPVLNGHCTQLYPKLHLKLDVSISNGRTHKLQNYFIARHSKMFIVGIFIGYCGMQYI